MNADEQARAAAHAAAREALSDGALTVDKLATLLLATHLSGGAEAITAVAGQPAHIAHHFADELTRKANSIVEEQ